MNKNCFYYKQRFTNHWLGIRYSKEEVSSIDSSLLLMFVLFSNAIFECSVVLFIVESTGRICFMRKSTSALLERWCKVDLDLARGLHKNWSRALVCQALSRVSKSKIRTGFSSLANPVLDYTISLSWNKEATLGNPTCSESWKSGFSSIRWIWDLGYEKWKKANGK